MELGKLHDSEAANSQPEAQLKELRTRDSLRGHTLLSRRISLRV